MHRDQANGFHVEWNTNQNPHAQKRKNAVQNETYYVPLQVFNPLVWFRKMWAGLRKLFVAVKFHFYHLTNGRFATVRIPWFKVAMVGLILFVFLKKDFRFQFNLRAPGTATQQPATPPNSELGMVRTVNWQEGHFNNDFISLSELSDRNVRAYVKRFSKVATSEMTKYGIPASIKMAQGILESQANLHPHTRKTNNHFGQQLATQSYNSAWENWRAHSLFVTKSRFKTLLANRKDVTAWANDLQATGYSNDPQYSRKLLQIISDYNLQQLDK